MAPSLFSPRKRARQSRAHDTQDAIVEAASRLVYDDGDTSFSTNRIAEVAGVSIGSLYQYFPGKDAILHALVRREFNRVVDGHVRFIDALDPSALTLEQSVASIVDHVLSGLQRQRPLYRRLAMSVLSIEHMRFTLENDARVREALRKKLLAYPQVDPAHVDAALFVAIHALKGVQIGCVLGGTPEDTAAFRAATIRALVAAVTPAGRTV